MKELFVALKMSPGTDRWESVLYGESLGEIHQAVLELQDKFSEGDIIVLLSVDHISSIAENAEHLRIFLDGKLSVVKRYGMAESWLEFWSVNGDQAHSQVSIASDYGSLHIDFVRYFYELTKLLKSSQKGLRCHGVGGLPKDDTIAEEIINNFLSGKGSPKESGDVSHVAYWQNLNIVATEYWTVLDHVANYAIKEKVHNRRLMATSMFGFIAKKDLAQSSAILLEIIPLHKFLKAIVYGK